MTKPSSASGVTFRSIDDLFEPTDGSSEKGTLTELPVDSLIPFEKHARVFFNRVSAELASRFAVLSSRMTELDAYERLRIFHDFFRSGEEEDYRFDFDLSARKGHSFIDAIAPSSMSIERDFIRIGDKFARVLFLKEYPSFLKDSMVREICEMQRNMMFSIDIIPVPTEEAVKEVECSMMPVLI